MNASTDNGAWANQNPGASTRSPADLERLLQEIRTAANVTTRTTVVLSTPYENRPPRMPHTG